MIKLKAIAALILAAPMIWFLICLLNLMAKNGLL